MESYKELVERIRNLPDEQKMEEFHAWKKEHELKIVFKVPDDHEANIMDNYAEHPFCADCDVETDIRDMGQWVYELSCPKCGRTHEETDFGKMQRDGVL